MRRVRRALLALAAATLLVGCGNDRTAVPDIGVIPAPKGFHDTVYTRYGLAFRVPQNWRLVQGSGARVATLAAGNAQIAVWRYPRTEPLPETRAQLGAARDALVEQIEQRDPTFKVTSTRIVLKPRLRAVEVVGVGTNLANSRVRRSTRSLHAYGHGVEIVLDAFAPPKDFARVDKQTFGPVARSLRLSAPRA